MPQLDVEKFVALEGQVLQPVPEDERQDYIYWRAAHLGNIALNFIKGKYTLNARGVGYAHFWPEYQKAVYTAQELVRGFRITQFGPEHHQELVDTIGIPENFAYPAMVLALQKDYEFAMEEIKFVDILDAPLEEVFSLQSITQPYSPGGGFIFRGSLSRLIIDPHSRQTIEGLFPDLEPATT